MRSVKIISIFNILSLFLLLIVSCSGGSIGYGILLWPPEDIPLEASSIVKVISESSIEGTYIIEDESSGEKYSLSQWRIEFYSDRENAEQAALAYRPHADKMALSTEVGLPVRADADAMSDRVYRLRKNEEIKVLAQSSEQQTVGTYQGYWYKVITADGTVGYCFDHYLIIYNKGEREEVLARHEKDPRIEDFLATTYYPERYLHLIDRETIDLDTLRPEFGLFPDSENSVILINNSKYRFEESYTGISEAGNNRYLFDDTSLYVTFQTPAPPVTSVILQFKVDTTDVTARYVAIPDIEEFLTQETERRDEALKAMIESGQNFSSNAYGSIHIEETGRFEWRDNDRLVPSVLKSHFGKTGVIRFDRFLSPALARDYNGAASFHFQGAARNEAVTFLYSLENQGMRLTLVTDENISDFVVKDIGYNSLVLFMTRQE